MKLIVLLLAVAACTDFESINRGVCGNGLLEEGEDCDTSAQNCVRCALTCSTAADCPANGYACGVDGLCHGPGGTLATPQRVGSFECNALRIHDVDADAIGDALGVSTTSIVVRYGDATDPLSDVDSVVTPAQTGGVAFGAFGEHDAIDLTIPTFDGLVSYTSDYGHLSPLPVQTNQFVTGDQVLRLFDIGPFAFGMFYIEGGLVKYRVVDLFQSMMDTTKGSPCGSTIPAAQFSLDNVDIYTATDPAFEPIASTDVSIALTWGAGSAKTLCVLAIRRDFIFAGITVHDVTPANAPAFTRKPILADLDSDNADRCPSLVNQNGGLRALKQWDGEMGPLGSVWCTIKAAGALDGDPMPQMPMEVPATVAVVGHVPMSPRPAGAANDALVLEYSIYSYHPGGTYYRVFLSTRLLDRVSSIGDLDGNGTTDIVVTARGAEDIDVLYRYNTPLYPAIPTSFQLLRLDTASQPLATNIGDFDGNLTDDVAYVEQVDDHYRLVVAYASSDHSFDIREVGAFDQFVSMAQVQVPDTSDQTLQAVDLLVQLTATNPRVSLLHGSSQRTMLAYFEPRSDVGNADTSIKKSTTLRGIIIGDFESSPGEQYADLLTFAGGSPASTPSMQAPPVRGWRVPGTSDGVDAGQSDGMIVAGISDCSTTPGAYFCIDNAEFLPWMIGADHDVVLGVDRSTPARVVRADATASPPAVSTLGLPIPANTTVKSLHKGDLDGDMTNELIAAFAPTDSTSAGAVLVCTLNADATVATCDDLVPLVTAAYPMTQSCFGAAPGLVSFRDATGVGTASDDVVLLCRDSGTVLYRARKVGTTYEIATVGRAPGKLESIETGDVTGDGVDDVVGVEGLPGSRTLVVFPQCTSRELAECRGTDDGTQTEEMP